MILKWIMTLSVVSCCWSEKDVVYSPARDAESRTYSSEARGYDALEARGYDPSEIRGYDLSVARGYDPSETRGYDSSEDRAYDPLINLSKRYPNSHVFFNPYDTRYSPPQPNVEAPYPPAVPYYAAREYGLPGLGYVITDPYSTKDSPSANTEQVMSGFSISTQPPEEVSPEEEESSETTVLTTTTPRPTKPPLPPPPPPPPPPPLPPPYHSTNSINLSPPRQSHRLPKLPPKPQTDTQKKTHRKKPKKKLDKNWNEPEELLPIFGEEEFARRKYVIEESQPENDYRYDLVNRAVVVSDPNSQQRFYYEFTVPSFSAES